MTTIKANRKPTRLPNHLLFRILGCLAGVGLVLLSTRKKPGIVSRTTRAIGYSLLMRSVGQYALSQLLNASPQGLQRFEAPLRSMLSLPENASAELNLS